MEKQNINKDKAAKEDDLCLNDNSTLQTKEEHEEAGKQPASDADKASPLMWDDSPTLADKITMNPENEDILTPVVDDDKTGNEKEDN